MLAYAASATLPGLPIEEAISRIHDGIAEPLLGALGTDHVQLCPQSTGALTHALCESLRESYPDTQFRLHANARVLDRIHRFDAATLDDQHLRLYSAVADRSLRLGATAYTLHAGYRRDATLGAMIDNVQRLQDMMGIIVGVEGLYPRNDNPQLMDSWRDYEVVMRAGIPMAIDLSHLNIVAAAEGHQPGLVRELVSRPETIEIHVSANTGKRDTHDTLKKEPWWWNLLPMANPGAVIFSEGNQFRGPPLKHHSIQTYSRIHHQKRDQL